MFGSLPTRSTSFETSAGETPNFVSSAATFTSMNTRISRVAAALIASTRRSESTLWSISKRSIAVGTLLRCKCPTRCQRAAAPCSRIAWILGVASCTRFSPKSRSPASNAARTISTECVFDTPTSVMSCGERPARSAAAATRARTVARLVAMSVIARSVADGAANSRRATPFLRPSLAVDRRHVRLIPFREVLRAERRDLAVCPLDAHEQRRDIDLEVFGRERA